MTPKQKATFIIAQAACAQAEIAAMQAANQARLAEGLALAYVEDDFARIPDRYGIGHNAVLAFFEG